MKKQKKSPWKMLVLALLMGALGALSGYYGIKLLQAEWPIDKFEPQGAGEKILFIFIAFFAVWVVIAFHELGHLSAGLVQGFRTALYTAGFLGVRGTSKGVKLFFNRQFNLMGGLAATYPERLESGADLRRKFIFIVASGPLASLVLCIAGAFVFFLLLQNQEEFPSLWLRSNVVFWLFSGLMSGFIFLATMIPSRAGGFMSDGARLLSLLDKGEKGRYEEATLSITSLMGAGKLPGEYPSEMLERLLTRSPDSLLGLNGHFTVFSHYLDLEEKEKALALAGVIEENISEAPAPFQSYYLKDVVFFYAFMLGEKELALNCWKGIQKAAERDSDAATFRVKAALALLEGDLASAKAFSEKGISKITDLPFEGQRQFEHKWINAVLKKTNAAW